MAEFFDTTSEPKGHGFSQAEVDKVFACYAVEPKADVPVKFISLDDTGPDDPGAMGCGHAFVDKERYDWLISRAGQGPGRRQADGHRRARADRRGEAGNAAGMEPHRVRDRGRVPRQAAHLPQPHSVGGRAPAPQRDPAVPVAGPESPGARLLAGRDLVAARLPAAVPHLRHRSQRRRHRLDLRGRRGPGGRGRLAGRRSRAPTAWAP